MDDWIVGFLNDIGIQNGLNKVERLRGRYSPCRARLLQPRDPVRVARSRNRTMKRSPGCILGERFLRFLHLVKNTGRFFQCLETA